MWCAQLLLLVIGVRCVNTVLSEPHRGPLTVEHVFFRQKAVIHPTRSQWIVGLVIDFAVYENYLRFTDSKLDLAYRIANEGREYFTGKAQREQLNPTNDTFKPAEGPVTVRLPTSYVYDFETHKRRSKADVVAEAKAQQITPTPTAPTHVLEHYDQYREVISGQLEELKVLRELHEQNWQDFRELKRIGHSEIDNIRKGTRSKRVVGVMLAGLAGLFSGFSLFTSSQLKSQVEVLKTKQVVMNTVIKESLSMINLTSMEVKENRVAIHKVIQEFGVLVDTFKRVTGELRRFVITRGTIQTNLGKVRDLISAESHLIDGLYQKVSTLSTGRLSPTILPAPELIQILKSIQVEIPPALMLPQDPREKPYYYYTVLKTSTIALGNELVIALEIPLLDVARELKVMEAIALPVPYADTDLTAVYDLEFWNFAVSTDGRQYVKLTLSDQLNCGKRNTQYCSLTSAIQETNKHSYCTLALYQRDVAKINTLCNVKVSNKNRLPIAHYVSDGEWLVATGVGFDMRKLCVGKEEDEIITVNPPYTAVIMESGCRALADELEIPIYFKRRQEYRIHRENRITSPPRDVKMRQLPIWKRMEDSDLNMVKRIKTLGVIKDRPIDDLIRELDLIQLEDAFQVPNNQVLYGLIAVIIAVLVIIVCVVQCKRKAVMKAVVSRLQLSDQVHRQEISWSTLERRDQEANLIQCQRRDTDKRDIRPPKVAERKIQKQ